DDFSPRSDRPGGVQARASGSPAQGTHRELSGCFVGTTHSRGEVLCRRIRESTEDIRQSFAGGNRAHSLFVELQPVTSQSIGSLPSSLRIALAREKGRLPKNPLFAESGEGCED